MVFTTTGDVADLRARVRHMADMHNQMTGVRGGGPRAGGPPGHGREMIPSHASFEEVPGGACLVFVPIDPAQLAALRQQVRMHAEMMQSGRCPHCPMCPKSPDPGAEPEQPPSGGG